MKNRVLSRLSLDEESNIAIDPFSYETVKNGNKEPIIILFSTELIEDQSLRSIIRLYY